MTETAYRKVNVVDADGNLISFGSGGSGGGGDATAANQQSQIALETDIRDRLPNFSIPTFDSIVLSYVGSTNNFNAVVYQFAGTTVATLTFTYVAGVPTTNDALLLSVVKS